MKMTESFKRLLDEQMGYVPLTSFLVEVWEGMNRPVIWERRMRGSSPFFVLRLNPIIAIAYGVTDGDKLEYWR